MAKVVISLRRALDYLLAEQAGVCAMANTICCTWIAISGETGTQLHNITEQTSWLKKVPLTMGVFL